MNVNLTAITELTNFLLRSRGERDRRVCAADATGCCYQCVRHVTSTAYRDGRFSSASICISGPPGLHTLLLLTIMTAISNHHRVVSRRGKIALLQFLAPSAK